MFKKIIVAISLMCGVVFATPAFDSLAYEQASYYIPMAEPAKSESQGYLVILWLDESTGQTHPYTYFWNTVGSYNGGYESQTYAYIIMKSNGFEFTVGGAGGSSGSAYYSLVQCDTAGYYTWLKNSSSERFECGYSGWRVLGWKYQGNVGYISGTQSGTQFNIFFDENGSSVLLQQIIETLTINGSVDGSILLTVNDIMQSVDEVEARLSTVISYLKAIDSELDGVRSELQAIYQKADLLLQEQKQSNTWLEKIYDYLQESQEQQKQEAQTQGNSSVSQGTSSIEDKGAGFANSMGGLVSSMSYSGTQCAWTFPEVKLPAIEGVMDEVVLIEEQPIDFTTWINAIPAPILLLIQSVLTMALIVYCFKELYGTISYVLTLRGGGTNE